MTGIHVFFTVRYSVLIGGQGSWKLTRQDWDRYRAQLFDNARLEERLRLFANLTLPSLAAQFFDKDVSVTLIVITSDELPAFALSNLHQAVDSLPEWIDTEIVETGVEGASFGALTQQVVDNRLSRTVGEGEAIYASVRLDDDDVLAQRYVDRVAPYLKPAFAGMILSFPQGYAGTVRAGGEAFSELNHYYSPKIALGMAHVGLWSQGQARTKRRNIFECGGHAEVDARVPVLYDASFPAFIRTFHEYNDSGSAVSQEEWVAELPAAGADALEWFPAQLFESELAEQLTSSETKRPRQKDCQELFAKLEVCKRERRRLAKKRKFRV